jgi:sensor histidine kinase YesM
MKFATGEYIRAMEESRKTLELLHEEEMQKMEVERRLETMKLEVLVNQVNPHFLFNTLNVIGGMAMLENAETTEKMIMALSNLFRYNLKNSSTETVLSQELSIVRDYMYIQQMRFGERLKFEIDCRMEENSVIIPTFTFQPLIENAIIHGLAPKEEGGKIHIKVWEQDQNIFITVCDTGVGIAEDKLELLKHKLEEGNVSRDSIGVGNVYRRFKIMYPEGRFTIYSRENEGTLIKLQIPCAKCAESN